MKTKYYDLIIVRGIKFFLDYDDSSDLGVMYYAFDIRDNMVASGRTHDREQIREDLEDYLDDDQLK